MIDAAAAGHMAVETTNEVLIGRTVAGRAAIRTVEVAMEVAGGAGFFRDLGLERLFRDVQAARYHPLRGDAQRLYSGRLALGAGRERIAPSQRLRTETRDAQDSTYQAWIGAPGRSLLALAACAHADVVTDANAKAAEIASQHPATPIAVRMMAIVQVSVFDAVNAVTGRYPPLRAKVAAAPGASVDAAVASATRTALLKLMPAQQAAIEADYQAALKPMPEGRAKTDGIAVGEQAAKAVLASCADDGAMAPNTYRPSHDPRRLRADGVPGGPSLGQAQAVGDGDRRPVPSRPPPSLTSDDLEARLRGDQGARRQDQHAAHAGADRDRAVLGGDGAGRLLAGGPLGRGTRPGAT